MKYKAPRSASHRTAAVFSSQPPFQEPLSFSWLTAGLFQESLAHSQGTLIICLVRFLVADIICQMPAFLHRFFWSFQLHIYLAARYTSPSLKYNFGLPHHTSGCIGCGWRVKDKIILIFGFVPDLCAGHLPEISNFSYVLCQWLGTLMNAC